MYCRLCLSKCQAGDLLTLLSFCEDFNWNKLCWKYLRVEIKYNDDFSKAICQKCAKILKEFDEFHEHVKRSQRLLPQLHIKLKEAIINTVESCCSNYVHSDQQNQRTTFVITEALQNEECLKLSSHEYSSEALQIKTEIIDKEAILEIPTPENILSDWHINETALTIKTEPPEENCCVDTHPSKNAQQDVSYSKDAYKTISVKNENDIETTGYQMHVPTFTPCDITKIPTKKRRSGLRDYGNDEDVQNIQQNSNYAFELDHSKRLLHVDSPFDLDEEVFRKYYRLTPSVCEQLVQKLDSKLRGSKITACSAEKLVFAALRFYASGSLQDSITEYRAIQKVTDAINANMCQQNIRFPMTSIEREAAKNVFSSARAPFNGAIGTIDCMHVAILAPLGQKTNFYLNRHGYHSINVQMICDPTLKILNVNARHPGSKDNVYIWNESAARNVMNRAFDKGDRYAFLIGDAKYALEPWLMTPLVDFTKGSPQLRYNEALYKARYPIQRLFSVLKGTWQCLSSEQMLNYKPQFAGRIVNACSVLHNLQLKQQECNHFDCIDFESSLDNLNIAETLPLSTDLVLLNTAKRIRNCIVQKYFSN